MSTPPRSVKVICPRCSSPYVDWLRHVNPRLDTFDETYLEACSSVTCPRCSFKLTSGAMAHFERPGNAAPVVRIKEETELRPREGERWSWHPLQISSSARQFTTKDWLWFFGSATECNRWRYDTLEVPGVAPEGSSSNFAQALEKQNVWTTPAEVYLALARHWHNTADAAQTQEPRYHVVAVEDVTHVLADFCTLLIREQCERAELVLKHQHELYGQTYLALAGFLLPHEVTALLRKLRRTARHTAKQKEVLSRWRSLLKNGDDLLETTNLNILFYALFGEVLDEDGHTEESPTAAQTRTRALARLEALLVDALGVS